jgi:hypothetical protein
MRTNIIFLILMVTSLTIVGCGGTPKDKFANKVFIHEENGEKQTVGFYTDKVIFKWDDSLGVEYHESEYNVNPVNDSVYNIEIKDKTPYMEGNSWQIILAKDGISFTSADSKKRYVISSGE